MAGLLVIRNSEIIYGRYGPGNSETTLWNSFSVTKSIVSMLVGAAIRDDYIGSVDEPVTDCLPPLKGSSYDQAAIRNILQMSSGIEWSEDYADPGSDINSAPFDTLGLHEYLRQSPVDAPPGVKFN